MENNLEEHLERSATGEHRLDPDQQREYLGTFRERVILTIEMTDIYRYSISKAFSDILQDLKSKYTTVHMSISENVPNDIYADYLKQAQALGIDCKVVSEQLAKVEFGVVLYTDTAINVANTDIKTLYPQFFSTHPIKPKKKSFWDSLFGK